MAIAFIGLVAVVAGQPGVAAAGPAGTAGTPAPAATHLFPTQFDLPDNFLPEGIAIGKLPFAFFGSRADGSIYRANLITGEGKVFSQGPGTPSLGLKIDDRARLFVAGGTGGDGRVVHAFSGRILASYRFAEAPPTFVNDVVLTPHAAWFTDSNRPFLYKVPLGRHGQLPTPDKVVHLPLTGEMVMGPNINANGIVRTPDGRALVIVQSNTGLLFRVDPATGVTTKVDTGGEILTNGDGLLLRGSTLYVVQNRLNLVAVLTMNSSGTSARLVTKVTDPRFDVPTTVASFADRLYLPNARFRTPPAPPETEFTAVAIPRPEV